MHQMSHPGVHSRAGGRAARPRREPACTCWAALHCMRCALSFCPPPERAARAGVNCSSLLQPFSQAGCNRAMLVPLAFSIAVAINASGSPPSDHAGVEPPLPKTARIPAGSFVMGYSKKPLPASLLQEGSDLSTFTDGDADESPSRTVTLDSFELGVTEVTNSEYEQFDPSHRSLRGRGGFSKLDNEAVVFVSYENATRYAAWLAQKTGKPYRLPTEAEWEYAARGSDPSTNSSYFWTGNSLPSAMAKAMNVGPGGLSAGGLPSAATAVSLAVGRFAPNSFGLHDVLGNVEEWCADWHGPYTASPTKNPTGSTTGTFRVPPPYKTSG